ncbi:MAG: aldehyde dehydrogenase family protein [Congregibacter sp.]
MRENALTVTNPSTGSLITEIAVDSHESAIAKLTAARRRFEQRREQLPLHARIDILEKLAMLMRAQEEELAALIALEGGKPLVDARVEAARAIAGVRIAINVISEERGSVVPLGHQAASAGRLNLTNKFPRGVVLAFSAFNHPLNLIVHQVVPAFASGCPCVVKPASDTPLSCLRLVELMHEAGVPEDYLSAVVLNDLNIATAMVQSDDIAFFSFIGSARVGWMLRSQLQPGVRCALEHGGVAPAIVTPSAAIDLAAASITKGGYYHAGQVCVSTQRVYVHKERKDELIDALTQCVKALSVGDAFDAATDVGPLIRAAEVDRVESWVREAQDAGAKIAVGGERLQLGGGHFYAPTLVLDAPADSRLSTQEVFGPVVNVTEYDQLEDALALANLHPHAFQAAIYTESLSDAYAAFDAFDASAVMVNDHTAFRDDAMPFAGLKASGLGVGGIPYTIEDMQFEKMLVLKQ